jgi:regulator of RNase E activity RraB
MLELDKLPHDGNGDAIRRVVQDGGDLTRPMLVDFMVAFPSKNATDRFVKALELDTYQVSVKIDSSGASWTCYCSKMMMLDYASVVAAQQEIDKMAEPFGGYIDGWGTFGNSVENGSA